MATNQDQQGGPVNGRGSTFDTHPLYKERLDEWVVMEDCYAGATRIKERGFRYLPATAAHRFDGLGSSDDGLKDYLAYKHRAVFHDVVAEAVQSMVGVMHNKEAQFVLPKALEPMRDRATPDGESLISLLRKINEQQLLNARVGLLLEVPTGVAVAETVPYIATYGARSLINWDTGVSDQGLRKIEMVALDESAWERSHTFAWKFEQKTRILMSDPGQINATLDGALPGYYACLLRDGNLSPRPEDLVQPSIGGSTLDQVPFVFCNANDMVPDPETPPLMGLAEIALALYRADADYRQALFMQGQDTLVIIGGLDGETSKRTGAGAILDVPKGGDAKYIGVSAGGLAAQKAAIDTLQQYAADRGSKLLDFSETSAGAGASGEALKIRVAARTTTLVSIARTGGESLKALLRMAAKWKGCSQADIDLVDVQPNTEFSNTGLTGADMLAFMQAKGMGLPISLETIHGLMLQNDITKLTYDDERSLIDDEPPLNAPATVPILNPDGSPLLHPTTGQPLTEPAPKRGIAGSPKPASGAKKAPAPAAKAGKGGKVGADEVAEATGTGNG